MNSNIKKIFRPLYVPLANWYYDTFKAPRRYHHLFDTIREIKAERILEVGVWNGKRAVEMIQEACSVGSHVEYFGFDLFEDLGVQGYQSELSKMPPTEEHVRALLEQTSAKITLYRGNTLETLPKAVGSLPSMDFIFIDGGHSVETIASDWKYIQSCMNEKTVVIFDDYWRNREDAGCKAVVDAVDTNLYRVEILPEIDVFNNSDFGRLEISFAKVTKRI